MVRHVKGWALAVMGPRQWQWSLDGGCGASAAVAGERRWGLAVVVEPRRQGFAGTGGASARLWHRGHGGAAVVVRPGRQQWSLNGGDGT